MMAHRVLIGLGGIFLALLLLLPVASAREADGDFSREELTQMLAPVALYPDALLSQVLMAATYPLEVVEADRWLKKNPLLKGDNLDEALRDQDWDASVKALCHVPAVLALMSERLDETSRLGDAFLGQEQEVMETIQDLRARAIREGNLRSDERQRVTVGDEGIIVIESVDPQTVYVPYYDTRSVYGSWWYPAWPPWYWGPGRVVVGGGINFWPEVYVGFGFGFGYWSHFDWHRRTIVIDHHRRPHFFRPDYKWEEHRGSWRHDPRHRRGAIYRNRPTAERFGQPPARVEQAERQSTRPEVRGERPEKGSPGREGLGRSDHRVTPERQREGRPPGTVTPAVPDKPERLRGGFAGPAPVPAPQVQSPPPAPERRDKSEVGRVPPPSRELSTDAPGSDSGYERRGGSGREGRQWSTQEGEGPQGGLGGGREERQRGSREGGEERGGFGRGGRR